MSPLEGVSGIAIWARLKRKASTRLTTIAVLVPWVTFPMPFLLNGLNSAGPLLDSPQKLTTAIFVLMGVPIAMAILQPRRMARLLPAFLLRSFSLNLLVLLATVALYLLPLGLLALLSWGVLDQPKSKSTNQEGYLLAYGFIALATYVRAAVFPAGLVLAYSGLSFFQNQFTDHRRLRVAQLIASLPLALLGGFMLVTFFLRTK